MEITNNFNFYDQSRFVKIENMDVENFSEYLNSYQRHSSVSDSIDETDFDVVDNEKNEVDDAAEEPQVTITGFIGRSVALSEELKSKEAKKILNGLVRINVLDQNFQPKNLTGYQKGYLARRIADKLGITHVWVTFGGLWNMNPGTLRIRCNEALNNKNTVKFENIIHPIFNER